MRGGINVKSKYSYLMIISGIVICLDQLTKIYVHTQFQLGESIVVIPDFFNFTYVRNPGAAFGIFAESHPEFREWFFLLMPPVALAVILWLLKSVPSTDKVQVIGLSLIFGGAIGNYIDRIRFRYVIDFIDVHYKNIWNYPAFNIADSAIVCGVGLMLLSMYLESKQKPKTS
jgi:signal peptidase II